MGQIGFRRRARFIDDLAQLAAAKAFCESQRQLYNVPHGLYPQICGDPKRAHV